MSSLFQYTLSQRQTMMSLRPLLHDRHEGGASTGLCSSRRCSSRPHPLGLTFHYPLYHQWRKGYLQGEWKFLRNFTLFIKLLKLKNVDTWVRTDELRPCPYSFLFALIVYQFLHVRATFELASEQYFFRIFVQLVNFCYKRLKYCPQ